MAMTSEHCRSDWISAFVVDKGTPGFTHGKKENKLGMRASETAELVLDNCRVPVAHLLGQEGEGLRPAMRVLGGGRISIAALSLGIDERSEEHTSEHQTLMRISYDVF